MQHCLRLLSAWPSFLSMYTIYATFCNWQGHFKVRKIGQEPRGNKARYQASLSFCPSVPGIQPSFFVILSQVSQRYSLASLSFCSVVPKIQYNQATLSCCPSVQGILPGFFVILSQSLTDIARTFCHSVTVSPGYSQVGLSYWPSLPGIQPGLFVILPHSSRDTDYSFVILSKSPRDKVRILCHSGPVSVGCMQPRLFVILS